MYEKGFFLADRTLDVSINLTRSEIDFKKLIRICPTIISGSNDVVFDIAKQCFPTDRHFNINFKPNTETSEMVLRGWVDQLKNVYIYEIKGAPVGFLTLVGEGNYRFVHLVAVLERYRPTGAGISLYAAEAYDCQKAGIKYLNGIISSANTTVMNLYSHLGGSFSNPLDVFLKECNV